MQTELVTRIRNQAVDLRLRDLLLNALTVSSGAVDAISFLALGKVFSAFMTGNIVFFGLRVAGASHAPGGMAIFVSMAAFVVGVYLSTRIVKPSEDSGVWPHIPSGGHHKLVRDSGREAALAGVLVSLFVGATAGGCLLVHANVYAPVLPFVITAVAVATAAIILREGGPAE